MRNHLGNISRIQPKLCMMSSACQRSPNYVIQHFPGFSVSMIQPFPCYWAFVCVCKTIPFPYLPYYLHLLLCLLSSPPLCSLHLPHSLTHLPFSSRSLLPYLFPSLTISLHHFLSSISVHNFDNYMLQPIMLRTRMDWRNSRWYIKNSLIHDSTRYVR